MGVRAFGLGYQLPLIPVHQVGVGVSGRRTDTAWGLSNTWSVPASVTQQLLLESTEGFDAAPEMPDDESYAQDWVGTTEKGDEQPITPEFKMRLRYEQGADSLIAAVIGSPAAPTVVSSQAATSLVAYQHVITLAPEATKFMTLANNMVNYIQEIRTFKPMGIKVSVGQGGRLMLAVPIVGDTTTYLDSLNTSVSIAAASAATPGNAAWRRQTRIRMNDQSGGALGSTDENNFIKEFSINLLRTYAQDFVANSEVITEPDDDGFLDPTLEFTFARMNTVSANSLVVALKAAGTFKIDLLMQGTYINSHTRRSILWEFPAVQFQSGGYGATVTGHGLIRPTAKFKLKGANAAPSGMSALTAPARVTIVNARAAGLLTAPL